MDQHYSAFISYKHAPADIEVASEIQKRLERYHVPAAIRKKTGKDKIGRIFRDKEELPITSDLSDDINKALEDADFLIVICSTSTKLSTWVPREIDCFLKNHSKKQVLTVLVDGEPEEVIPERLLSDTVTRTDPDGATYEEEVIYEPLSCDFRMGLKEARRAEIPRLAAALLGCKYDELVRREHQYKRRRNLAIGIPAACALVVAIAYLIWSRNEIAANYQRAEENYQLAQENYRKSEENYQLAQENYQEAQANLTKSLINQSSYLSSESSKLLDKGDRLRAILLAMEALPDKSANADSPEANRPVTAAAQDALVSALQAYMPEGTVDRQNAMATVAEFAMEGNISDYQGTDDGHYVVIRDSYGNVGVWDIPTLSQVLMLNSEEIRDVQLLSDTQIVVLSDIGIASYDIPTGKELWRFSDPEGYFPSSKICLSSEGKTVWAGESQWINNPDYTTTYSMRLLGIDASTGELTCCITLAEDPDTSFSAQQLACSRDGHWVAVSIRRGYSTENNPVQAFLYDSETDTCTELAMNREYSNVDTMRFYKYSADKSSEGNAGEDFEDSSSKRTEGSSSEDSEDSSSKGSKNSSSENSEDSSGEDSSDNAEYRLAIMAYPLESSGEGGQYAAFNMYTLVQPMEIALSCYDPSSAALIWENSYFSPQIPKIPNGQSLGYSEETGNLFSLYGNKAVILRLSDGRITDEAETTTSIVSSGLTNNNVLILYLDNGSIGAYYFDDPGKVMEMSYFSFDLKRITYINQFEGDGSDLLVVPEAKCVWLCRSVYDEAFVRYEGEPMPKDLSFQKEVQLGDKLTILDYEARLYLYDLSEQQSEKIIELPGENFHYELLGGDPATGIVWIHAKNESNQLLALNVSDGTIEEYRDDEKTISYPKLMPDGTLVYWITDYPENHLMAASVQDGVFKETVLLDTESYAPTYYARPDLQAVVTYKSSPEETRLIDLTSGETINLDGILRNDLKQAIWQTSGEEGDPSSSSYRDSLLAITDGNDIVILQPEGAETARLSRKGSTVVNMTSRGDELIVLFGGGLLTRYSWTDFSMLSQSTISHYESETFDEKVTWDFEDDTLYLIRRGIRCLMHIIDLDSWEQEASAQFGIAYDADRDRIVSFSHDGVDKYVGYFPHYSIDDLFQKAEEALHGTELTEEEQAVYGLR